MRVLITGSSGPDRHEPRPPAARATATGSSASTSARTRGRMPSRRCSRISRATTRRSRAASAGSSTRRRRPRRPPRRAREGAPARAPAAPRARERDHDVQRARVRARARAAARLLVDARGVRRRAPLRGVRRGGRRLRLHGEPVLGVEDHQRGVHLLVRALLRPATTSSSASRTSTDATTTTSGGWSACCRSSCTSWRAASRSRSSAATTRCSTSPTSTTASTGSRAASNALADGRVANETINLAYGQGNTLVRAAELIAAELGVEPQITMAPSLLGEVTHYVADVTQGARAARLGAVDAARRRASRSAVAWFREWRAAHPEEDRPFERARTAAEIEHGFKQPARAGVATSSRSSVRRPPARRRSPGSCGSVSPPR